LFQTLGRTLSIAQVLEAFVCCAAAAHQSTCALTLAGAAAALRRHVGVPTVPHDQLLLESGLESARRETGYTVAALCWNEGWGMQTDKAVEYALSV
jgi:hypothetical protein